MRQCSVVVIAGLFLLALAAPAQAGVCYDWYCDEATRVCQFDASCTYLGTSIMYWAWNFGDGSTYVSGTSPLATHAYDYRNWAIVTLTVHYWWESAVSCEITIWNAIGPAVPTWGQCSGPA